ncbi:MAG: glycerate kinase [Solirubrobacteraceae bacterium]
MSPRSRHTPDKPTAVQRARAPGIPQRLLLACGPLGPRLSATTVASALTSGICDAGRPGPDICVLSVQSESSAEIRELLDELDFDARMRHARAVVIAAECLEERTLAGSVTFEIATRARQGGIPAYAVTGEDALSAFDARILDLQVILQARSRKALLTAGRKLAELS